MNTERSRARMESFRWMARLDGVESAEERCAFEQWHAVPENAAAFARARWLWGRAGALAGRADMERLAARVHAGAEAGTGGGAGRPRFSRRRRVRLAAMLAMLLFGATAFVVGRHVNSSQTYVTASGQRSTIELDDGSWVTLNVATRLDVKLGKGKRLLKLRSGEAIFTVAEDSRRPFVVAVGDGEVTALGTRFQVRNEDHRVTVTLLEGRIAVDRVATEQHIQLNPGEQLRFAAEQSEWQHQQVDPDLITSWTAGRLKFRSTPLAQALAEVNRYSRIKIRLADSSLAQRPVDGVFEIGNTASVVSALTSLLPVEVGTQDSHEIVLLGK